MKQNNSILRIIPNFLTLFRSLATIVLPLIIIYGGEIGVVVAIPKLFLLDRCEGGQKAIDKINQLAEDGNKIIIFTSRFMGMNNENINKANLQGFDMTYNQLKKWNVKFDKLILGKPTYDIMIDDKHFLYDDTWIDKLK